MFVSIVVLVAAIQGMLFFLNNLKLENMLTQATASRLQLATDMIEDGFHSGDLSTQLPDLARQFKTRATEAMQAFPDVHGIALLDAAPPRIVAHVGAPVQDLHLRPILKKGLSLNDGFSAQDLHGTLYTARPVADAAGTRIGVVVVHLPVETFGPELRYTRYRLMRRYMLVFVVVNILMMPVIYFQFRVVGRTYRSFSTKALSAAADADAMGQGALAAQIALGNARLQDAEAEFANLTQAQTRGDRDV